MLKTVYIFFQDSLMNTFVTLNTIVQKFRLSKIVFYLFIKKFKKYKYFYLSKDTFTLITSDSEDSYNVTKALRAENTYFKNMKKINKNTLFCCLNY